MQLSGFATHLLRRKYLLSVGLVSLHIAFDFPQSFPSGRRDPFQHWPKKDGFRS
jgi:hypothetical protein